MVYYILHIIYRLDIKYNIKFKKNNIYYILYII